MKCNKYNTKSGKEIRLWQGDCMELMDGKPENYWDLAIVDPEYGIDLKGPCGHSQQWGGIQSVNNKPPNDNYFRKLSNISDNYIIWGANYFDLPSHRCVIVWDKGETMYGRSFSECEIAEASFNEVSRIHKLNPNQKHKIHPTQKPVKLYRWLLENYAEEGNTILDTHGGSMSLAIACYIEDFELDIIELDEDYYNDAIKRFEQHISQQTLF